eukprot:jgi/Bigna1/78511/fgenesh1_pg.55_\
MAATANVEHLHGIEDIVDKYDAFLVDQFGVIHDGKKAYTGAIECMGKIFAKKKPVILLSNSSKKKDGSVKRMVKMGFSKDTFADLITSGDLVCEGLKPEQREGIFGDFQGRRMLVFGNGDEDDEYLSEIGTPSNSEDADFILARGTFSLLTESEKISAPNSRDMLDRFRTVMCDAKKKGGLKMLVSNPDLVRPDGDDSPMPGQLGNFYESLGGQVTYVGKPHSYIYDHAFDVLRRQFGITDKKRICAIGDVMYTDILGANSNEIDSILILDGVHASELGIQQTSGDRPDDKPLKELLESYADCGTPTYVMDHFQWGAL